MLACILRMGELLLSNGAEAMRVEDTVTRLCRAYGFSDIHIFSIPSSIVLTVKTETGALFDDDAARAAAGDGPRLCCTGQCAFPQALSDAAARQTGFRGDCGDPAAPDAAFSPCFAVCAGFRRLFDFFRRDGMGRRGGGRQRGLAVFRGFGDAESCGSTRSFRPSRAAR